MPRPGNKAGPQLSRRECLALAVFVLGGLALASSVALAQAPRPSLYTFSSDSDAGFEDERLESFRRDLGDFVKKFMELGYSKETALVSVQFLGQGELTVELDASGMPARHLWVPSDDAPGMWAIVRVGDFAKPFDVDGSGARSLSRLAKSISEWLEKNEPALRKRLSVR